MLWPMRPFLAFAAAGLLSVTGCATVPARPPVAATYVNPVLDADFPDPTVIRAPDGSYYGYGTQTQRNGRWINIQIARSVDLVHWRYVGDALPVKPNWASTMQDFWAPHLQHVGSRYIMYYSAKPNGSNDQRGLFLGV